MSVINRDNIGILLSESCAQQVYPYLVSMFFEAPREGPAIGTGSLLEHNGKAYILTCSHVGAPFAVNQNNAAHALQFETGIKILGSHTAMAFDDPTDDICLLEVTNTVNVRKKRPLLSVDGLEITQDFTHILPDDRGFIILGFPGESVQIDVIGGKKKYTPIFNTFFTQQHLPAQVPFLDLQYQPKAKKTMFRVETQTVEDRPLQEPFGYSGSPVMMIPHESAPHYDPKKPSSFKVVGLQSKADLKKFARVTPLRKLRQWLGL